MFMSMTGYGFSEADTSIGKISVEISGYNKKGLELNINIPRSFCHVEKDIRAEFSKSLYRGKLDVNIYLRPAPKYTAYPEINIIAAKQFISKLKKAAAVLKISTDFCMTDLMNLRELTYTSYKRIPEKEILASLKPVLKKALNLFMRMRMEEGKHLYRDVDLRLKCLKKILKKIKSDSKTAIKLYREKILHNLKRIDENVDDERIIKEIAFYAEKCDISEEITRIESHFSQFGALMARKGEVGRAMDFMIQELFREINTVGSKANDYRVSSNVINFKAELEKIREQIQNVE
ncbi:MAG: YicC family protein [Candidatus Aureabacteria bacterium]|nr:YicC family protein [Candidatus Auribacterota bacterium]